MTDSINELATGIVLYENVLPDPDDVFKLISHYVDNGAITWKQSKKSENNIDESGRYIRTAELIESVHITDTEPDENRSTKYDFFIEMTKLLDDNIYKLEKHYRDHYKVPFDLHESYYILKYSNGQEFNDHIDDGVQNKPRRVSTVLYLNDDYEGGALHFPRFDLTVHPKKNQLLIFPSTYVYNHSALPVTGGEKRCVVSWIS